MLLPTRIRDWPPIWLELFNERAAVMEYGGKLPRWKAEQEAERDIRQLARNQEKSLGRSSS